jgi:hypothetical protein
VGVVLAEAVCVTKLVTVAAPGDGVAVWEAMIGTEFVVKEPDEGVDVGAVLAGAPLDDAAAEEAVCVVDAEAGVVALLVGVGVGVGVGVADVARAVVDDLVTKTIGSLQY